MDTVIPGLTRDPFFLGKEQEGGPRIKSGVTCVNDTKYWPHQRYCRTAKMMMVNSAATMSSIMMPKPPLTF